MKEKGLKLWMILLIAIAAFVIVFLLVRFIPSLQNSLQRMINSDTIYTEATAEDLIDEDDRYTILDYPFDVDLDEYVTMDGYDNLVIAEVEKLDSSEEAIDNVVNNYIAQYDKYEKKTEGTVSVGDIIDVSYEAYRNNVLVSDFTTENHVYTFGLGGEPDDFIDNVDGAKIGEELEFEVTFPDDDEDYPGVTLDFVVTVNSVNVIPEVTDDNVEEITDGDFTSVEDFRDYLEEGLIAYNQEIYEETLVEELEDALLEIVVINDIPQELVDWYASFGMASVQLTADNENTDFETVVETMGYDSADELAEYYAESAATGLAETMAIMWIAQKEGISFDETEDSLYYENRINELMTNLGMRTEETVLNYYKNSNVERDVIEWKTWEFLMDNVTQE